MQPLSVRDKPDHMMVDLSTFIDLPVSSLILLFLFVFFFLNFSLLPMEKVEMGHLSDL